MELLRIENLHKQYPAFELKDVSFSLDAGFIMGFIGMNGAGKTTTLKSMLNMVHPDHGSVHMFGKEFTSHEIELKNDLGVLFGDMTFYPKSQVRTITSVVKRFYSHWDDVRYESYCRLFKIDQTKRISELSAGMRTKYSLALALSHHAKLFILDEPTSGLDPAARDELLEIFQQLVEDGERSVIFSTHITSDLEKCADYITYIHEGEIIASATRDDFIGAYSVVKGTADQLDAGLEGSLISCRKNQFGFSGLLHQRDRDSLSASSLTFEVPTLEDIMIYYARKEYADVQSAL